ncbi:HlyC/CorC family transporter [bacterium]|nr:HlyC/CorC family transporter [bacterium]
MILGDFVNQARRDPDGLFAWEMSVVGVEILFIFLLLLLNGLFAMIEIAVVSSRKSRLRQWAEAGDPKARAALDLVDSPNRFLSTTQIGITLVGVLAGAFGGATLAKSLAVPLKLVPAIAPWADPLAVVLVVSAITYFSLVIGELVPKRIGMGHPEMIARLAAGPMTRLSRIASPVVKLLGLSTDLVLALLRVRPAEEVSVSEEEVKMLVRESERSGSLIAGESEMVEAILGLDSLCVRDLMIRRGEIVWLDAARTWQDTCAAVLHSHHSHFPVFEGRRDNLLGMISIKDLFAAHHAGHADGLKTLLKPPLLVPPTQPLNRLLETFRKRNATLALVADEFGGIAGLITLHDVMETIIGDFDSARPLRPEAVRREDGSWLVDAMIRIDELADLIPDLPLEATEEREYSTLGGLILQTLGKIPATGEHFTTAGGFRIEVVDLDRNRIDKVLIHPPTDRQRDLFHR